MTKRELAIDVIKTHLGLPYKWGGDDTVGGFDCSGLVVEVLKSVGIVNEKYDNTAHGLSKAFPETDILEAGALVYWDWNNDGIMEHVEMIALVDDDGSIFTIGASGGGSATTTPQSAMQSNAYVKLRPLRSGYKLANDPFTDQ